MSDQFKAPIMTNLILQNEKKEVLLMYRQNTEFYDHMWGLPVGLANSFESPRQAIIRKAHEELNIDVMPEFASVISMHRPDALNSEQLWQSLVFFFQCHTWNGELINNQPEKCETIGFFPLNSLPHEMIPICIKGLENFVQKISFSEYHVEESQKEKRCCG